MTNSIATFAVLLLIAAIVGVLTRRLQVPYSVGLVVTGIALAFLPVHPTVSLTRDLVFTGLLPPLIFEAAFTMRWETLRPNLPIVVILATLGVLLSAVVTATAIYGLLHWPGATAALFGILIAATDPVAVIATLKECRAGGPLGIIIEAESLLNDGTAAVLFSVATGFIAGEAISAPAVLEQLGITLVGGLISGAIVAVTILSLIQRTDDRLLEVTLTTVAAYGSFLLAEHFGGSGVLATLTTGLLLGNLGRRFQSYSAAGVETVVATQEFITFIATSLIFLLIGLTEGHQRFGGLEFTIGCAILVTLLGRAAAVYPICAVFSLTRQPLSGRDQHVLMWGGLRGALGLALALSIPDTFAYRNTIVSATFGVVVFSVLVQGLTVRPLLRQTGSYGAPPI